jgi:polyphosphate kinase
MEALMNAVKLGKQVFVFVEVKARFDEEANLKWGERLAEAGVKVKHSFPGVKVHAKLALVRRQKGETVEMFSYLGTGNFHEVTAKIYSDFGLFTANLDMVAEVSRVFAYLENREAQEFKHLLVGQFNLRSGLVALIDQEIINAKAGKEAKILLKLNSLQDAEMIAKLYEASNAGVKIQLIIRGICCLVTQLQGWSENIEAISIVDRFLEHARVFIFHNEGHEKIYLSSADWMVRNLSFRVETAFPVYDEAIKKEIKGYINLQLTDNTKARIIDNKQTNGYRKANSDIPTRSQIDTYYYIKRKTEAH